MSGDKELEPIRVIEQMQQAMGEGQADQPRLSESFQTALDVLKRSKDIDKKIEQALPGAMIKLENAENDEQRAEANAIIQTLAGDDNPTVRVAVAREVPRWAGMDANAAGMTAYNMAAEGHREVGMTLAEGLYAWLDKDPDVAERVAKKLTKNKGMGVNLALADALPMWAEHHAETTGKIAKKIAKNYNHLNAVTNLLEKTYGEKWRENIETVTGETAEGEDHKRAMAAGLFLKAGEHVKEVKVSLASGLADWAGYNPDAAEEVVDMMVTEAIESPNTHLNHEVNEALLGSLKKLAPDHPRTTARLVAAMAQNPDPAVSDSLVRLLSKNLNVDPNQANDVVQGIEDHPAKGHLIILSRVFDSEGEENLLDQLGL